MSTPLASTPRVTRRPGLRGHTKVHHDLLLLSCGPLLRVHQEIRPDLTADCYVSIAGTRATGQACLALDEMVFVGWIDVINDRPCITSCGLGVLRRWNREHGLTGDQR